MFILPDVATWWYQGTGLQRTDVALSSLLDRQLGMTCLMNCVTFLFLGLFLEVVLKLIFSHTTSAPSAFEVFHYNALYKFMFTITITIYHYQTTCQLRCGLYVKLSGGLDSALEAFRRRLAADVSPASLTTRPPHVQVVGSSVNVVVALDFHCPLASCLNYANG